MGAAGRIRRAVVETVPPQRRERISAVLDLGSAGPGSARHLARGSVKADYAFTHDVPLQRVIFACGALARIGDEVDRLKISRALIVATPGSGERLGKKVRDLLGARAVALHAQAVIHVPKAV